MAEKMVRDFFSRSVNKLKVFAKLIFDTFVNTFGLFCIPRKTHRTLPLTSWSSTVLKLSRCVFMFS